MGTYSCISMATLNCFMLLSITCGSEIERECIVAFVWQQWLCEHTTMLHYVYFASLVILFQQSVMHLSYTIHVTTGFGEAHRSPTSLYYI